MKTGVIINQQGKELLTMKTITVCYELNGKIFKFYIEYDNKQELKEGLEYANQYYTGKLNNEGYFCVSIN